MSKRKSSGEHEKIETDKWLMSYADLMNNLLILFMLLYAISATDLEKFKEIADQFRVMFGNVKPNENASNPDANSDNISPEDINLEDIDIEKMSEYQIEAHNNGNANSENVEIIEQNTDSFYLLYQKIKDVISEKNYGKFVDVDKIDEYIYFRFKDGILFYPDLPEMKEDSFEILSSVGNIIKEADSLISSIEINGYTAKVSDEDDSVVNFRSWELSVNRSLTVLKYFIQQCGLPQSKMSISGFAHFQPSGDNATPEGRAVNRRVEIRIARYVDKSETGDVADNSSDIINNDDSSNQNGNQAAINE